jgi:small-conductance mechanosensitive channel
LAYGLREAIPAMMKGGSLIQPTLKSGQKVTLNGRTGTVEEAGSYSIILKDDEGRTIVIPTKNVIDKEVIIESGPEPAIQENMEEERRRAELTETYKQTDAA